MKLAYAVLWAVIPLAFYVSSTLSLPAQSPPSSLVARPINSESHHLARLARLVSPYLQRLQQQHQLQLGLQQQQQQQPQPQINSHRPRSPPSSSSVQTRLADQDGARIAAVLNNSNNNNANGSEDDAEDFEDPDWMDFHDNDKRQYDDYGHLRFGKRGDFDDYGHMRFGRSAKTN